MRILECVEKRYLTSLKCETIYLSFLLHGNIEVPLLKKRVDVVSHNYNIDIDSCY